MSVHPRSAYASNRPISSVYSDFASGSRLLQYPKSVITFELLYDPPAATMSDPNAAQHHVPPSPQRRPGRVGRVNSPKPVNRHQVGVKKIAGGVVSGGKALSQRNSATSPPTLGHYRTGTGFFTITAYLPFDGGKRLKVNNGEREGVVIKSCRREEGVAFVVYTQRDIYILLCMHWELPKSVHMCTLCTQLFGRCSSKGRAANGYKRTCLDAAKTCIYFHQV